MVDDIEVHDEAAVPEKVSAEIDVLKFVNLALMQNGLPVAQNLRIENLTQETLTDVVCSFSSVDGLILPSTVSFREVPPNSCVGKANVEILLNQRRILEVHGEPVQSSLKMVVTVTGHEICQQTYQVTILGTDQWLGIRPYAELLSAYVLPNADFVNRIQAEAANEIQSATGDSSLEGYQSGKKRVLEICAAIYSTIQKMGISYCNPPSSFGQPGQKIRLPDAMEKYKLGTCIETSLLFAAVMEKCQLHPVLILIKGHCYVGCHLVEETFADVIVKDMQTLRKRADLDEFVAIETTKVTSDAPFNEAERLGRAHLDDDDTFTCAIDVVRSRETGIRPMSFGSSFDSNYMASGRDVNAERNGNVRELQESVDLSTLTRAQTTQSRIDRWTQKLLDFSARNRLLNIPRTSRQVIPLMCSNVGALEDQIAANKMITIRSIVDSMGEKALDDLINKRLTKDQCNDIIDAELSHHRLCVMMPQREVMRRLSDLYHDAKTELEESGVNTLFLSIGVLQWVEPGTGINRKSYRAPILMVPVRLERSSMAEGVKMFRLDEDTTINTTLIEFLRSQFNLLLPGLDPLPTDDSGVNVPLILQIFRQTVKDMEGWEVFDDAYVGCFSFGKFVMWKDMTDRVDELKKNPLVNHLIGGGGIFDDGIDVFPADEVSQHIKPGELFCPVSYDSSQLTAVLYSEMGKSFVLHGPPGTGKSQTITNIIAHNLALGRRVLFVSEKKAALDVVKDRLDRIGLTPFCLELHSNKTEKGKFYEQIKAALSVPETDVPGEWEQLAADFEKNRCELDGYIMELHKPFPNGLTAYNCFSRVMQYGTNAHVDLLAVDCLIQDRATYQDTRHVVQELATAFRGVTEEALKATPELKFDTWSPVLERQFKNAAQELSNMATGLLVPLKTVYGEMGIEDDSSVKTVTLLVDVLSAIKDESRILKRLTSKNGAISIRLLGKLIELSNSLQAASERLTSYRIDQILELDLDGLERRLEENRRSLFLVKYFKNNSLLKELSGIVKLGGAKLTIEKLANDLPTMHTYVDTWKQFSELAGGSPEEYADMPANLRDAVSRVLALWPAFNEKYAKMLEFADEEALGSDVWNLGESCKAMIESIDDLRNVLRYRKTLARAKALGVGAFADYLLANDDGTLDVLKVFDDAYASKMLDSILAQSPILAEFTGLGQEERIERFRSLDKRYTEVSKKMIFAKLAATLPRRRNGPCPEGSELGMLKRECEKKSRHKAVRQTLLECKTLISTLKPCFLMSPLSVAQYLPVDSTPFDLIVFDEASQIPVWDAIGVIARGAQLIVVGDPKQMPPTSFFQKGDVEDEDLADDSIADQESILDECLVAGVYSTCLNWHYRSRHEALIAFSNEHYYDNKLCTFPSAMSSPRLGVKFVFVDGGKFERQGKGPKVNAIEAEALVNYICTEVRKADYKKRSIGVVTFSMSQQKLIRTMLDERRSEDPVLEKLLPEEGAGAYFVKNLENVQGDESDVILFSVGYAPDENGKFSMNFGPLNLSGGERRLNVAITRAKEQVIVFSSIHGSQIDAGEGGRTKAVGAGHLKAFLEYAERGSTASSGSNVEGADEEFINAVVAFLKEKGYEVDRNVGCSEYRIDVAVRDPESPDKYLMGIECDGLSYAGQRTAQDRDVNRVGVLKGLGWHMCHVWSVDWTFDRKRAEEHLLQLLDTARTMPLHEQKPEINSNEPPNTSASPVANLRTHTNGTHLEYKVWKSSSIFLHEYFYEPSSRRQISQMLQDVISTEWPIYDMVLRKRVSKAWGLSRMTEAVHRIFDMCMPAECVVTEHEIGKVYWPKDVNPSDYKEYRVPSNDPSTKRTLEEIPPEELMNAMCEVLTDLGGCHQEELYKETLKLFGLSALTSKARKLLDVAFVILQNSGMI